MNEQEPLPGALSYQEHHRRRVAHHESAHACVALAVGFDVVKVSLRPEALHLGMVSHHRRQVDVPVPRVIDVPFLRGPHRDRLEDEIIVALAGDFGALLAGYRPPSGYGSTPDTEWAEAAETVLGNWQAAYPTPEDEEHAETDFNVARGLSYLVTGVAGGLEQMAHLAWLREVAKRMVAERVPAIQVLAAELLIRRELTGTEAAAVSAAPRKGSTDAIVVSA